MSSPERGARFSYSKSIFLSPHLFFSLSLSGVICFDTRHAYAKRRKSGVICFDTRYACAKRRKAPSFLPLCPNIATPTQNGGMHHLSFYSVLILLSFSISLIHPLCPLFTLKLSLSLFLLLARILLSLALSSSSLSV